MVIEAAGIQFVADKEYVRVVTGLRLDVEQRYGRNMLVASNSTWGEDAGC